MTRMVWAAAMVLTLSGLVASASAFRDRSVRVISASPPARLEDPVPASTLDLDSLIGIAAARRLFVELAPVNPTDIQVEGRASLDVYTLFGVFVGSRPSAVVAVGPAEPQLVGVGDSIGEAIVHAIEARSIRLVIGDTTLALTMSHAESR